MLHRSLAFRVVAPTVFLSLLLLGLCTAAAWYLYHQQASSAAEIGENVTSRKIANLLVIELEKLNKALGKGDAVRIKQHQDAASRWLGQAWDYADKPQERQIVRDIQDLFEKYDLEPKAETRQEILRDALLPQAIKLQEFNSGQIESSEQSHREIVPWLAWGLAAVGVVASIAGLVLGYGVAKGLRHSIYQLSVRVRDAAGKLGQDLPTVTVEEGGDLSRLHEQLHGMVHDIEQVVQRLQQREREVLRAEQLAAVGQVAAGVAHELRNPLTSIKMLVQTSREEMAAGGLAAEDLRIIEHEIRRMERCLQTFLDFARPPKPERKSLALTSVIDRTLDLVGGRARKQGIHIRVQAPKSPIIIEADAEQLQQVFVNLILNAFDAMPRGGNVEIEMDALAGNLAEVRVADTGPGIAAPFVPRLFEPFASSKETGLGLGLVISRRIVENHGGTLTGANRPDGGACFVVRLPSVSDTLPTGNVRSQTPTEAAKLAMNT